ncbi:MAG: CinA family protein [Dermatophilaceae bacterium]
MSPAAHALIASLRDRGLTIATAESLTGGLVCAALTDVPGASAVVRGGVVGYATDAKASVLGVDPDVLGRRGAVDPEVARQMAAGVCRVLASDVGVSTTGVAGPDAQDGQPVGTVHIAVSMAGSTRVSSLLLHGDRPAIRRATVVAALDLVSRVLDDTAER